MKMKKTRLFILTGALTMLLAGCGDSDKRTKVYFWAGFGTKISDNLEAQIAEYNKNGKYSADYRIVYESDGTGYDNLLDKISLSVTNSTYPHIAVGYPDHMAGYIASNILKNIDGFIEEEKADPESTFDLDDYIADYMVENQTLETDRNGNQLTWGLPLNKSTEVMVVNKTMLGFLQSKDPTIKVPETWTEVEEIGEKIHVVMKDYYKTVQTYEGKTLDFKFEESEFRPLAWDSTANMFITLVRAWGGTYTEAENYKRGYYKFDSPETREMLTYFKGLADDKIIGVPGTWGETSYSSSQFQALKTMFTISSSAGLDYNIPNREAFEIEVHPIPYKDEASKTVISQGTNIIMFKQGTEEEQSVAWDFMKYITSEVNDVFASQNAYFPVTTTMLNSDLYKSFLASGTGANVTPKEKAYVDAAGVNADVYSDESWTKFVDPGFLGSSTIRSTVGTIIPNIFVNGKTVQEAINDATSGLKKYKPAD